MLTLLKQEFYKVNKQRSTKVFFILLLVLQVTVAFYSSKYPKFLSPIDTFTNSSFTYVPIIFFYIAICSTSITKERQYGTLRSILYRQFSFDQVLLSKIMSLFIQIIMTFCATSIISLILKFIFFNKLTLTNKDWQNWVLTNFNQFLTLIFLTSLVILLSTLLNNSNLAIIIGIIGYFAINIFNQLLLYLIAKFHWLKWNPLNMMNLGEQLQNSHLHNLTRLTLPEISIGYTIYILLFLGLAFYCFRKREI